MPDYIGYWHLWHCSPVLTSLIIAEVIDVVTVSVSPAGTNIFYVSCDTPLRDAGLLRALLLVLLLGALVVDYLHVLRGDQLHAVLLSPVHAALKHQRQEHARHV